MQLSAPEQADQLFPTQLRSELFVRHQRGRSALPSLERFGVTLNSGAELQFSMIPA